MRRTFRLGAVLSTKQNKKTDRNRIKPRESLNWSNKEAPFLPLILNLFGCLEKQRKISGQSDKATKMGGGREEGDDEGEDESFVVLMLNELENAIELL